ncbi:MAG: sialate O-acetylesterase [Nitrospirae bacterium]|nr:sialate O-acetylesterase [Nitrospirota bacterium]
MTASADVRLPALFSDNMVLQRQKPVHVWGTADPGERITVNLLDRKATATADDNGRWETTLASFPAGGPYQLTVRGKNTISLNNVMVGDVWIASGQSNMHMNLKRSFNAEQEIASAKNTNIRLFTVPYLTSTKEEPDVVGNWVVCSPQTVPDFSAAAYFFGRKLQEELKVPIGLIHASRGGTPAELWISREGLEANPALKEDVQKQVLSKEKYKEALGKYVLSITEFMKKTFPRAEVNTLAAGWQKSEFDDSTWPEIKLPSTLEDSSAKLDIDGIIWFRKTIYLPDVNKREKPILSLGMIDDFDVTYVNGKLVGYTGPETIKPWKVKRNYIINPGILKTGRNVIAVRLTDLGQSGGFVGQAKDLRLVYRGGKERKQLSLAGNWKYAIEVKTIVDTLKRPRMLVNQKNYRPPNILFNAMIHPLLPYPIRGVIWYQGESNTGRAYAYRTLFPALIRDWRARWGQGDFPFYFVQLANFFRHQPGKPIPAEAFPTEPQDSTWAELREAQLITLLTVPKTGMAVTIDIGEANNIHPRNKQDVGKRLALIALAREYGKDIIYSGPIYASMKREGKEIRLTFKHLGSGLVTKDGEDLKGFAIAGKDCKFAWAKARIEGPSVVVWNDKVPDPIAVRYAWGNSPTCNLFNEEGLPASPFRTDDWQGKTQPQTP